MWLGLAVSILAVWLALRGLDLQQLWQALAGANYLWLIPATVLHFVSIIARAVRWQILLGADKVDLSTSFWVENIGYLVANIIHARVGDASRVALMSQRKPVGVGHTFSTVVLERIFDMLATVIMALMLIPVMPIPPEWLTQVRLMGAMGIIGVAGAIALVAMGQRTERLLAALLARIPRIKPEPWLARWRNLVGGFGALGSARGLVVVLFWTAIVWAGAVGLFWAVLMSFLPQAPFHATVFVLVAEAFGMVVPATPGNWGVFEVIAIESLTQVFGLPKPQATSYAIIVHILEYLLVNVVGLVGLLKYSLSLGQIRKQALQKESS